MTDHSLNLLSLNARGLSNFRKRRTIFTWCRKRTSDIFLQETHSTLSTQLKWKNEWGAELICSHGSSNSRGVAILIKKGLDCVIHSQIVDTSGISIGNEETKILQYADDTTAILADTSSATALFRLLDDFKIVSGLKINCSKTEAMWIGSSRNCKAQPFGIKWPNEPIKALGIYYTYN